jgi:hypothetical protein
MTDDFSKEYIAGNFEAERAKMVVDLAARRA